MLDTSVQLYYITWEQLSLGFLLFELRYCVRSLHISSLPIAPIDRQQVDLVLLEVLSLQVESSNLIIDVVYLRSDMSEFQITTRLSAVRVNVVLFGARFCTYEVLAVISSFSRL
jgi:hypothetical protein